MSVRASLVTHLPLVGETDFVQFLRISDGDGAIEISVEELLTLIAALDAAGIFADPDQQEDAGASPDAEDDYVPQQLDEPEEIVAESYVESGEIGAYTSHGIDLTGQPTTTNGHRPRVRASRVVASQ